MVRKNIDVQKNEGSKILGYTLPYLAILSIWLIFVSPLVTNLHGADALKHELVIKQDITTPMKGVRLNTI